MTLITHLLSMFKNPGYVPIPYQPSTNYYEINSNSSIKTNNDLLQERSDLFCKKCNNPRPLRAHHCKICGKCTLKMDHHCHWIANCVGYYNQKNFYQFLFYSTFGDLIGFFLLLIRFFSCKLSIKENVPNNVKIESPFILIYYLWEPINIMIGILCSFAMTISIGTLFYKQTWMLLLNQTTIDKKLFEDWNNSPYYEENKSKNFNSVMGETFCDWISLKFQGNEAFNYSKKKKYYDLDNIENES
jgi:palmitoyltransferase